MMTLFKKYIIPSCSKATSQHITATPVQHGWYGVLFAPYVTFIIMGNSSIFVSSNQRTFHQNVRSL